MLLDAQGNPISRMRVHAQATGGRKSPNSAIAQIANTFKDRSRKDIASWRRAIKMAEDPKRPNRQPLMDLYNDLLTDGHLQSQMGLRRDSVLNTSFHVIDRTTGNIDEALTEIINAKWFYDLISTCVDTIFYGHSLLEIQEVFTDKLIHKLIPRRHVIPQREIILPDFTKPYEVIQYTADIYRNWMIEIGDREDLGALNNVIPNLIWKRNVSQSWAEFCERFGIPMVTATTVRTSDEAIEQIEEMLQQLGEAAYGVFPEGTTIDFKEANRTDVYQVFQNKINQCNSEISKLLVGGTMVSDNGSSRSQSEVHERNLDDKLSASDRREITFFINDIVFPLLKVQGFKIKDSNRFTFDTTQELSLKDHWGIVKDCMNSPEVEIDYEWVAKTFNVPVKKKVATEMTNPVSLYAILPKYDAIDCDCAPSFSAESLNPDLDRLQAQLIALIYNGDDMLSVVGELVVKEAQTLFKGLMSGYGDRLPEAKWNEPDHLMLAMMEANLFDFSASKTEARLASISSLLIDYKKQSVRSFSEFKEKASQLVSDYNDRYLKTEYNLSVATGQTSAAFMRAWSEKDDFPYVQYITVGDSNVRPAHAELNRRIFNIKDADARKIWPPNDYGCRCEMDQYPHKPTKDGVTKGADAMNILGDKFKDSGFAVNRADLKQIFLDDQKYAKQKGVLKNLSDAKFPIWGQKAFSEMTGLKKLVRDKSITADNVKDFFKAVNEKGTIMEIADYMKRRVFLSKKTFTKHTTGDYLTEKQGFRHQLFPVALSIISNPDEVWMYDFMNQTKLQMRYIGFFNGEMIAVDAEVTDLGLEIKTWYPVVDEDIKRKGLLIYNKP